jgi:hypothetical protein
VGGDLGRICVEGNEACRVICFIPWTQETRLAFLEFRSGIRSVIGSLRRTWLVERLKETGETRNVRLTLLFAHFARQVKTNQETGKKRKKKEMANVGIEPKTFALLARRSNQLS